MASTEQAAALGAFLSGVGTVLSATWYVKRAKKQADKDCQKRIDAIHDALHEGIEIGRDKGN